MKTAKKDLSYSGISRKCGIETESFTFDDSQKIAAAIWDAAGITAFSAPNGNMIHALCNLAAQQAQQKQHPKSGD